MPRPPKWILGLTLIVSLALTVSALVGLWVSISSGGWIRAGFEGLLLVGAVFGALTGLGFFRQGPAMALACVGGTVFFATVVAFITRGGRPADVGPELFLVMGRDPHTGVRLGAAVLFGLLCCAVLMARRPAAAMRHLGVGLALLAPVALLAALWTATPLGSWIGGLNPVVQTLLAVTMFLVVVGLVSAGLHNLIRALEVGRVDPPQGGGSVNAPGSGAGAAKAAEG